MSDDIEIEFSPCAATVGFAPSLYGEAVATCRAARHGHLRCCKGEGQASHSYATTALSKGGREGRNTKNKNIDFDGQTDRRLA